MIASFQMLLVLKKKGEINMKKLLICACAATLVFSMPVTASAARQRVDFDHTGAFYSVDHNEDNDEEIHDLGTVIVEEEVPL